MKVIFFTKKINKKSGWNNYGYELIKRISKKREIEKISVFCSSKTNKLKEVKQIPILRKPLRYLGNSVHTIRDFFPIRSKIKEEIDSNQRTIIHFTNEGYSMFVPFLLDFDVYTVMTIHGTYSVLPLKNWKTSWLYRLVYKKVDKIISVSNFTKKHLLNNSNFIPEKKIKVVTNGVNFKKRHYYTKEDSSFRILSVGAIKKRKGQINLLKSAKLLRDYYKISSDFKIIFVGKKNTCSNYYSKLVRYIEKNSLEDLVKFTGMVSEKKLNKYYAKSNLFSLLSIKENYRYEGYPLVFHEAAMFGLPTIGSYNCGAKDAIKDGKTGFLVNPKDHKKVAKIIKDIINKKKIINPKDCIEWAKKNDWSNKNLLKMYKSSIS